MRGVGGGHLSGCAVTTKSQCRLCKCISAYEFWAAACCCARKPVCLLCLVPARGRVARGRVGVLEAFERAVRQEDGDDADDCGEEVVLEREGAVVVAEHAGGVAGARGDDVGAGHHCGGVGCGVWVAARREQRGGVAVDAGVAHDRGGGAVVGGGGDGLHVDLKGLERAERADGVVVALGPERDARGPRGDKNDGGKHPLPRPAIASNSVWAGRQRLNRVLHTASTLLPGPAGRFTEVLGGGLPLAVAVQGVEEALADVVGHRAVFVDGVGLDAHDQALEDLHNTPGKHDWVGFRSGALEGLCGRASGNRSTKTGSGNLSTETDATAHRDETQQPTKTDANLSTHTDANRSRKRTQNAAWPPTDWLRAEELTWSTTPWKRPTNSVENKRWRLIESVLQGVSPQISLR